MWNAERENTERALGTRDVEGVRPQDANAWLQISGP